MDITIRLEISNFRHRDFHLIKFSCLVKYLNLFIYLIFNFVCTCAASVYSSISNLLPCDSRAPFHISLSLVNFHNLDFRPS